MMFQPAPLSFFEMDDFIWNVWTQSLGTSGHIGLELVDDFVGIRINRTDLVNIAI